MKTEIKERWVADLRSGKYKQGRNMLRRGNRFCCLGVLCDIVRPDGWERLIGVYHHDHGSHTEPSRAVRVETGLLGEDVGMLVNLNDNHEYSFDKIADWIEYNL